MADGVAVSRSIQFVSLDTHPANNALVVSYEILVSIIDGTSKRELSRRNKRAQLQIHIKEFDQLLSEHSDSSRATKIDLGRISSEIIKKCPILLSSESQNLEDIQLHLLYLVNRRQSSLLNRNQEHNKSARPASSTSSTRSSSSRLHRGGRSKQQSIRQVSDDNESVPDIYGFVRAKEAANEACCFDIDRFEEQFNEYLDSIETSNQPDLASQIENNLSTIKNGKIDTYLEGLYGDRAERFLSLAIIRRLCVCGNNETDVQIECNRLIDICSNRLLICAMIRNLRDSSVDRYCAREFILHCLMNITRYEDIYLDAFERPSDTTDSASSIDLVKILCDLLAEHVKNYPASSLAQQEPLATLDRMNCNYYLCAILVVFINLFKINKANPASTSSLEKRILSSQSQAVNQSGDQSNFLGAILSDLFQLNARDLMREIRLMGKPAQIIQLLNANIILMRQFSCVREFILRIRCRNQFLESIVSLLNCLQLSRPGSGNPSVASNGCESILVKDKQTLNELYHLELNLLMLVNNLLLDSRIRSKLIKRKLLKPVLRNLVIFLAAASGSASRPNDISNGDDSNNYLDRFSSSLVMIVPFRSLYELSCDKSVRLEIYKSKIIMKSLLEYLLSLCQQEFGAATQKRPNERKSSSSSSLISRRGSQFYASSDWMDGVISISEPTNVSYYILSVWINLSSLKEAPIYNNQELELKDLLSEYIDLALDKLRSVIAVLLSSHTTEQDNNSSMLMMMMNQDDYNLIYLHMKLLRNVSQFIRFAQEELEFYQRCLSRLSDLSDILLDWLSFGRAHQVANWNMKPYLVESLASLGNLIAAQPSLLSDYVEQQVDLEDEQRKISQPHSLASIFSKLSELKCENFASEEDDDLLLISVRLIGFIANKLEICHLSLEATEKVAINNQEATNQGDELEQQQQARLRQRINVKILHACNFVLSSKLADYELIIHTLYSLSQLMNHSEFLKTLLSLQDRCGVDGDVLEVNSTNLICSVEQQPSDCDRNGGSSRSSCGIRDSQEGGNLNMLAESLVDKLANLVLHTGFSGSTVPTEKTSAGGEKTKQQPPSQGAVSRLALELLNLFRQLEQQTSIESSFVHKIRFANYNTKWLAAIQTSREALESASASASASSQFARDRIVAASQPDAASWFGGGGGELLFGQDDDDDDDDGSKRLLNGAGQQLRLQPMMEVDEEEAEADPDEQDLDSSASGSFGEAPDLNVIDPNSMIKHLSSRRQLRQTRNEQR